MMNNKILASFSYFDFLPLHQTEKPYEILINLPDSAKHVPRSNFAFKEAQHEVQDVRGNESGFELDKNGFCWKRFETTIQDLRDKESIEKLYLPEVEEFLRNNLEGSIRKIHLFDWRLRASMRNEDFLKRTINLDDGADPLLPSTHPHVDQSPSGAIRRCEFHLPESAAELLKGRFRIVNVWRPITKIVSWPLALCDTRTVDANDLIANDLVRRRYVGESWLGMFNANHQWFYLSDQEPEEVCMLKIYDSNTEVQANFCMHTSFRLSEQDEYVVRESLEVRALIFDYPDDDTEYSKQIYQ